MEEKTFYNYLINRLVIVGTLIPFVAWIISYFRTSSIELSLIWFLSITTFLLLTLLFEKFREYKKYSRLYKRLELKYQELILGEKETSEKFDRQSKQYAENIQELNHHKQITMVVSTLVRGSSPETKEGRQLITLLKVGLENLEKDSENNGV